MNIGGFNLYKDLKKTRKRALLKNMMLHILYPILESMQIITVKSV